MRSRMSRIVRIQNELDERSAAESFASNGAPKTNLPTIASDGTPSAVPRMNRTSPLPFASCVKQLPKRGYRQTRLLTRRLPVCRQHMTRFSPPGTGGAVSSRTSGRPSSGCKRWSSVLSQAFRQ